MSKIDYKNTPDYQAGLKVFLSKYAPDHLKLIDDMYELSPALADTIVAHGLCDIWERKTPLLSVREKEIATLASLITSGTVHSEIKAHTHNLLNLGVSKDEIIEILILMTVYAGVPKVVLASQLVKEAFAEYTPEKVTKNK